jgi:hypothetical protein
MKSLIDDFDVDKPLPPVLVIKCAENHLHRIGLSLFTFGSQKRNRFHNPFFISSILLVGILWSIFAVFIKRDKFIHLLIGDYTHFLNKLYFMNSALIVSGSLSLSLQLLHYWKYYKNESPSYLKPFEMISGLVSPKSIGLINREDINQLLNRSELIFKLSRILSISLSISTLAFSALLLIPNSTLELILVEIFWMTFHTLNAYFCANLNFSQMTYFYIICLYLKLKLRNANNSIRKSFEKKYKISYHRMKNILNKLSSIISEINTYNNDLWSKYLMIVLMLVIIGLDLVFFQSIFGKISLFLKIIMFYVSSLMFLYLIILINTASSVSLEANKSYKLLNKMFITYMNNKQISIRMRIKV